MWGDRCGSLPGYCGSRLDVHCSLWHRQGEELAQDVWRQADWPHKKAGMVLSSWQAKMLCSAFWARPGVEGKDAGRIAPMGCQNWSCMLHGAHELCVGPLVLNNPCTFKPPQFLGSWCNINVLSLEPPVSSEAYKKIQFLTAFILLARFLLLIRESV